jgi:hypothetical protein
LISKKKMFFMLHIHGVMWGGHVFIENGE